MISRKVLIISNVSSHAACHEHRDQHKLFMQDSLDSLAKLCRVISTKDSFTVF